LKVIELKSDELVIEWFKNLRAKPSTQKGYLACMQEYTEFTKMSPLELVEEAEAEAEAKVKPRKQKIRGYITEFRGYLINKGVAPLTVENRITGVRSFYKSNDIIIPVMQRREENARPLEVHKKIPDKGDIIKVLEIADPLETAIILVGASSGLAVNEICNLKIKDFKSGYDHDTGITTLSLRREKTTYDFITFITPEASRAVLNYLAYRERAPKSKRDATRRDQLYKQKLRGDDGFLFINRHISDDYLKSPNEEMRKLKTDTIQLMFRVLCEDSNGCAEKGVWNIFRSHNLRKFFNNRLIAARCDPMIKEFLMGHKIHDKTKEAYFVADQNELKAMYKDFVPFLTISKEMNVSESEDFKRVVEENEELKGKVESVSVERYELIQLKEEIARLKQMEISSSTRYEEFAPFIEEGQRARQVVEDFFGMSFEEAIQQYDVSDILPKESEALNRHYARLSDDLEYRERYKEAVGKSRRAKADREQKKAQDDNTGES
jgi:integrase